MKPERRKQKVSESDSPARESLELERQRPPDEAPPEIVARKVSVVGPDGKPRITLSVDDRGDPRFVISDGAERKQLVARIGDQGVWLQMILHVDPEEVVARSVDLVALSSGHLGIEFTVDGLASWGVYTGPDGSVRIGAPPSGARHAC